MTNANLRLFLLAAAAATTAAAAAQTTTHHAATASTHQHTTTQHAAHPVAAASSCMSVPPLSPKIPAAPAGSSCPRPLLTITETPNTRVDYMSPLVGPALRQQLDLVPVTFSLGYVDTQTGTGPLAQPHMWYTVQYTGYLTDGTKFDASADHPGKPFAFLYGGRNVIPGWDMGFEGMHVGGKRRLFVPYQLAYGERGRGPIPPKAELVFDMELVAQSPTNPEAPPAPPANPGTTPRPMAPGGLPATPPTGRPQTGPDVKPAPPVPGSSAPQTPPPTAKQPPPSSF